MSLWGLMFNLFLVRVVLNMFSGVANYAVKPVVRCEGNGSYLYAYGWWLVLIFHHHTWTQGQGPLFLCLGQGASTLINNAHGTIYNRIKKFKKVIK